MAKLIPESLQAFYRMVSGAIIWYVLGYALSFSASIAIARHLGPEGQGQVAAVFALINIGITLARAGTANLNKLLVAENPSAASPVFFKSAWIALLVCIPALPLLFMFGHTPDLLGGSHSKLWLLLAFIPLQTIALSGGDILMGMNRSRDYNRMLMMEKLLYMLLAVIMLYFDLMTPMLAVLLFCLAQSSQLLWFGWVLRRELTQKSAKLTPYEPKLIIKNALAALCFTLGPSLMPLYLSRFTSYEQAGYYGIAQGLTSAMLILPTLYSSFAIHQLVRNQANGQYYLMKKHILLTIMLSMTAVSLPIALLSHFLIVTLYGERFAEAAPCLLMLLPSVIFIAGYQTMNAIWLAERRMGLFLSIAGLYLLLVATIPWAFYPITALSNAQSYSIASGLICVIMLMLFCRDCRTRHHV